MNNEDVEDADDDSELTQEDDLIVRLVEELDGTNADLGSVRRRGLPEKVACQL